VRVTIHVTGQSVTVKQHREGGAFAGNDRVWSFWLDITNIPILPNVVGCITVKLKVAR